MTATVRRILHRTELDLAAPQPHTDIVGRTRMVHAVRIEYGLSALDHRVDVIVEYEDCARLLPPVEDIEPWLQNLIDQHRPDGPACTLT